jgi:hypothetical protein
VNVCRCSTSLVFGVTEISERLSLHLKMYVSPDDYPFEQERARDAALRQLLSYRVPDPSTDVLDHSIIEVRHTLFYSCYRA